MGRDVVGHTEEKDVWDNYQCKHCDHPLYPEDIWLELGKLAYYTFTEEFTCPRKYYFVAPRGVGTKLSNLLKKPDMLCTELIKHWGKKCRSSITGKREVILDDSLLAHIHNIDFSIFCYVTPYELLDQYAQTRYHVVRFGGGLPHRPEDQIPPEQPGASEAIYLKKLIDAYGDFKGAPIGSIEDIQDSELIEHYRDSRVEFYSAESLRSFSRDSLPEGEFEKLQNEVHDGIRDEIRMEHPHGYQRVLSVVRTAKQLPLANHSLQSRTHARDKGGICHQLANEKDAVKWVKDGQ